MTTLAEIKAGLGHHDETGLLTERQEWLIALLENVSKYAEHATFCDGMALDRHRYLDCACGLHKHAVEAGFEEPWT